MTEKTALQDLEAICDEIAERWDSDMRPGKLLYALMGRVRNYRPDVTRVREALGPPTALIEPWKDYHGDLPDYDHPLRCVYESGIQYAVQLLARELSVTDYAICDGTEEFDGDLGGTMMNIVRASLPKNDDGEHLWPSEVAAALSGGVSAIAAERHRQIEAEGWTPEHDDEHRDDLALARAAACYALAGTGGNGPFWITHLQVPQQVWPYRWEWKPKDRRANLVRAGALIAAEIDRLDRSAAKASATA